MSESMEKRKYPPLIYIAGPYSAATRNAIDLNIAAARHLGRLVIDKGWYPVIPHANTYHFDDLVIRPQEFWLSGTLNLMEQCDAVIMVDGWEKSRGAVGEMTRARELGIPVYMSTKELPTIKEFESSQYKDIESDKT